MPLAGVLAVGVAVGQATHRSEVPAPLNLPHPEAATDAPYAPQPLLPGGVVIPLYPSGSPLLHAQRVREPERYSMNQAVPGRIENVVNIHVPSIEVHTVETGMNTGSTVILIAGGGHRTLNTGPEAADFVSFFSNYGVNTVILRNRLRNDGYNVATDAVVDAEQAIRLVRAYATEFHLDAERIGVMGFSAGGELASAAAILYPEVDTSPKDVGQAVEGVSARPDFVALVYPGPTPFAPDRKPPKIPRDMPPSFLVCGGSGDQVHAVWAVEYLSAMLAKNVPNVEMHIYANGRHPGDLLRDGSHMTGGLSDRNGTPFGTWQIRFIDWFRDLGFLQKPGIPTKSQKDLVGYEAGMTAP
ncbi:MAG: alpha/beta hydrolase [Janthinobacterium lividum]